MDLSLGLSLSPPHFRRDAAASIFASYGTPGILLDDLNPARLTASGLSPSWQEIANTSTVALAAADASGQTLEMLLERSGGAALSSFVVDTFDYADQTALEAVWTVSEPGGATGVQVPGDGTVKLTSLSGGSSYIARQGTGAAGFYRVAVDLVARGASASAANLRLRAGTSAGSAAYGDVFFGTLTASAGVEQLVGFFYATGANPWITVLASTTNDIEFTLGGIRIERIAGNHLIQTTAADELTLVLDSGIWRLRGDGLSKNFLTPLTPATSMTLIVACEFNAVNDVVIGCTSGAGGCRLGTGGSGRLAATVGSQDETTITGGSDIRDVVGIAVLRFNASLVTLKWKPLSSSMSGVYGPSAMAGTIPTSTVMRVAGYETSGIAARPLNGDIYRLYAQQAYLSDAEISTIASQWSRELGGTG